MSAYDQVRQLVAHLASLEAGLASEGAAARELAAMDPVEAAHALKVLSEQARESQSAGHALALASRALMFGSEADLPYSHRGRIYDAAVEFGLSEVAAFFVTGKDADPEQAGQEYVDPTLAHLTLGHKKTLARQADPDKIARLALESDPRVVRELLFNPRMTEPMVVRIVARRPSRPETLMEVWRSPRWSVRTGVRRALALNPYTPPEITLKILPHLLTADLAVIAQDRALHPSVREVAQKLSAKRKRMG